MDLHNRTKFARIEQITKTADFDGATIDRVSYPGSEIRVDVGTTGSPADATNYWELKLYHATEDPATPNTALASSWAVVPEEQLLGAIAGTTTGVFATIDDATEDDVAYSCGYIGPRRFLRVRYEATLSPGSTTFTTFHEQFGGRIPAV